MMLDEYLLSTQKRTSPHNMASNTAENSCLSPGLTLVDSLRQGLGEAHVFRAFFSDLSHDMLLRYSPGTH